ncbi:MAG: hypothetical protein ABSF91_05840 [Bacteroidota bacterium]|jgi:hypothetical protein
MRISAKILVLWLCLLGLLRLSLLFPHRYFDDLRLINIGLQLFLFLLCGAIALKSTGEQKFVYLNFSLLFGYIIFLFAGSFVGMTLFKNVAHSAVLYHFYVNNVGLKAAILISILFPILAYRFKRLGVLKTYLVTIAITLSVIALLFGNLVLDPLRLFHLKDYEQLGMLRESYDGLSNATGREPTNEDLIVDFGNRSKIDLSESRIRVEQLRPYLQEGGKTVLFWMPIENSSMLVNLLCLIAIAIFLYSVYTRRRITSAYLDKIMAAFFLYWSLDTFQMYCDRYSFSREQFHALFAVGQYFTFVFLLMMVYAFSLRLRFVLSELGKYYETVLQVSPEKLTQWKDEIDNFILKTFFPKKPLNQIALISNSNHNKS